MSMPQRAEELRATVSAAVRRLAALPETEVSHKPSPARWSKKEILGHLVDSACNNHQRFVRAQLEDRLSFPGYEQEGWARCQGYAEAEWPLLLELWRLYNTHLANVIALIPEVRASIACEIGGKPAVTLTFLVEDYIAHMEHHLRQLDRRG